MIYLFTCATKGCENNTNPVNLCEPKNPVRCSLCYVSSDAVKTDEPCPVVTDAITD